MKSLGILFYALLAAALVAQDTRDVVPLKNWSTPLYWQPNRMERETTAKPTPQLQFSGSAVSLDALTFVAVTPCRLVDTRGSGAGFNGNQPFGGPSIAGAGTATFPVQLGSEASANTEPAPCGVIPPIAAAYSFNVTVVPHGGGVVGYVSIWPAGSAQPAVATLNDREGVVIANAAIVPAGTPNGGVSVYNAGPATIDLIIDMNGFFAAPSDLKQNTALGADSLASNTTGSDNTASGSGALASNTTGDENTAAGYQALFSNVSGNENTAAGVSALMSNLSGSWNTANGFQALSSNTIGNQNTASGYQAMLKNISGIANTADGAFALGNNTTGSDNTASGSALAVNTTGTGNTASGDNALGQNTTGNFNVGVGFLALGLNTTGGGNIGIGLSAGGSAPGGNNNSIYIGSTGTGVDNSGTIQIGSIGNNTDGTYIAGISGASVTNGVPVLVNSSGQLGTMLSSGRFKDQITDMGNTSNKLLQLRPVTFFYKPEYDDGSHLLQYGLIAEEVAKVYPELVAYDRDGRIQTVQYQKLTPMLLNELQKQDELIRSLERRLAALEALLPTAPTPVP